MNNVMDNVQKEIDRVKAAISELERQLDVKRAEMRGLNRAMMIMKGQTHLDGFEEPKTVTEIRNDRTSATVKTLADEILEDLPKLLPECPKGPTVKQICGFLGAEEYDVRSACHTLAKEGRAQFIRRKDSQSYHLFPNGVTPPAEELTKAQAAVVGVFQRHASENGFVQMPVRQVCEEAEISKGNFGAVIDALMLKGRIKVEKKGSNSEPNVYRILGGA